jgi:hypothetical protein
MAPALASMVLLSGCSKDKDDDITPVEGDTYDVELIMTESDQSKDAPVSVDPATQSTISARIYFTDAENSMKRMYFTQDIDGAGAEPYEIDATVDKKADGSIDIVAAKSDSLEYIIDLPVPSGVSGTVVYTIWTTTGKGDPRDATKKLAVGVGTITLNYGGSNTAAVKSYSAKLLAAPLADGSSETFISLYDGNLYKISDGEEYAALWDFGYFNRTSAGLSSASNFDTAFPFLTPTISSYSTELNNCYFATSSMDFDAVTTAADLNSITSSTNESITDLVAGSVVEFVDNYGKKGLIKVIEVKGTFNSGDYMKIDVKVQP